MKIKKLYNNELTKQKSSRPFADCLHLFSRASLSSPASVHTSEFLTEKVSAGLQTDRNIAAGCICKPCCVYPAAMPRRTSHASNTGFSPCITSHIPLLLQDINHARFSMYGQTDGWMDTHTCYLIDTASHNNHQNFICITCCIRYNEYQLGLVANIHSLCLNGSRHQWQSNSGLIRPCVWWLVIVYLGAKADTLRTSSLALCYSVAEYCCPVWSRSSHTNTIDSQLHSTMRLISGCLRPTQTASGG